MNMYAGHLTTPFGLLESDGRDEKQGRLTGMIITGAIAVALFLTFWLIKIITPIPAIPPDPEVISLEIGLIDGTGGDAETQGGGSFGNTGTPGSQQASDAAPADDPKSPTDKGSVTDPTSDNDAASDSKNDGVQTQQPSKEMLAVMNSWKKNKGAATINIGGDGRGDPYTGGLGDGSGSDVGPGGGDPGTGGPGGGGGKDPVGESHRYRKIVSKPDIVNPTQEEGKVVVNVYVDRKGNVTKTEVNPAGTTTTNSVLRSTATQSAYKIVFNPDPGGPESLKLSVDIYFTLK
jgi:hypothetical protein